MSSQVRPTTAFESTSGQADSTAYVGPNAHGEVLLTVHEDNAALIRCVRTGRNPSMRDPQRTHRVTLMWLHERFQAGEGLKLVYTPTKLMAGDVFTIAFTEPLRWANACSLISIYDPKSGPMPILSHPMIASGKLVSDKPEPKSVQYHVWYACSLDGPSRSLIVPRPTRLICQSKLVASHAVRPSLCP